MVDLSAAGRGLSLRALITCAFFAVGASSSLGQAPIQDAESRTAKRNDSALTLEDVVVTARKQEEDQQDVPESIAVLSDEQIRDAGILDMRDASYRVPNLTLSQFSVSRLSFPFIRGVGSGRNSPAVTTYIDDVPQVSFATSNIEFFDLDRIEFIRGPQGTLYGRNTLGGVINLYHRQPTNALEVDTLSTFGTYALQDNRMSVKGPIVQDKLYFALSGGFLSRNGFTQNDFTDEKLDDRNHEFGRAELRFTPDDRWDIRLTLNGERDRDGDYALTDLAGLHETPRHLSHDFEGESERDVSQIALTARYAGDHADFISITALQHWRSQDITDLDETAADFIRRNNKESQQNFIQEFRVSSPANKPAVLSDEFTMKWLAGTFFFASDTNQNATNDYRPGAVGVLPQLFFPFQQTDTIDEGAYGIAIFGQTTLTYRKKLDLTAGLRFDYEHRNADLATTASSPLVPGSASDPSDNFNQVSPRFEVGYHWTDDVYTYVSAAKGYKAGGFNGTAPAGGESFGEERSWTYEAGVKTSWLDNRLRVNADYFYIDWQDLQLDTPAGAPGVFFIDNAGDATSHGAEVELSAVVLNDFSGTGTIEIFGGAGLLATNFGAGSTNQGADIAGNNLPFAPDFTYNVGAQYSHDFIADTAIFARAEAFGVGQYSYDASNAAEQDTYTLIYFRVGISGEKKGVGWRLEAFLNNAFNEKYVPIALPFGLAPSGYVGESGPPQTVGISLGLSF